MPREHITAVGGTIEVTWGRDHETIEVATTIPDGLDRIHAILTEADLKLVYTKTGGGPGTAQLEAVIALLDGWHTQLGERRAVNQLIRVLQSARDQAFGKDA